MVEKWVDWTIYLLVGFFYWLYVICKRLICLSLSENLTICDNQGRVMLPMSLTTDDGPIYVNAKQYHGIIRRRQIRAKAMMENRLARTRKVCKSYSGLSKVLRSMSIKACEFRFLLYFVVGITLKVDQYWRLAWLIYL